MEKAIWFRRGSCVHRWRLQIWLLDTISVLVAVGLPMEMEIKSTSCDLKAATALPIVLTKA